jgi:hypothetical protein
MSQSCVKFLACICLLVLSQSTLLAQDGRGSRSGSWRASTTNSSTPYRYSYPPAYVVPATPIQPVITAPGGLPSSPPATPVTTAKLTVLASESAQVWFNGTASDAKDGARVYTSGSIETGKSLPVAVKISMSGSMREIQLTMQAGDAVTIDLRGSQ